MGCEMCDHCFETIDLDYDAFYYDIIVDGRIMDLCEHCYCELVPESEDD